jgi:hypothetical protein
MRLSSVFVVLFLLLNIQAEAQLVCAPLYMSGYRGFAEIDLKNSVERTLNSNTPGGPFIGASTFDPVNKRYIYARGDDKGNYLVLLDAATGKELQSVVTPHNGMFSPEYCIANNTVYSITPNSFASYDLTYNVYRTIATYPQMSVTLGISTFSQATQTYYTAINKQLTAIDIKTGKRTFYDFSMTDFEVDDSMQMIYGKQNHTLFSLNLKTGEIKKIADDNFMGVVSGCSTYDPVHHVYIQEGIISGKYFLLSINVITGEMKYTTLSTIYSCPEYYDTTTATPLALQNNPPVLYPNPVTDQLHMHLPEFDKAETLSVSVYDMSGKHIDTYSLNSSISTDSVINLSTLSNGLYLLRITDGSNVWMEKVVKE